MWLIELKSCERDFLWADSKNHLVGWDKVCSPMANGDLGIRKLTTFNKAILGKWVWQLGNKENQLWRRVVASKFGEEWGVGGDGLLSWVGEFMGVVCREVFVWVGRILANILSLLLQWGIE